MLNCGELGKGSYWMFELGKLGKVSFGMLKLGEYDEEVSFGMLDTVRWVQS